MKAKIKATGEIVNIAEYAKIQLDIFDTYGGPIELRPDEIEFVDEPSKDEHWQNIRERAAIAAMQGTITILGSSNRHPKEIAEFAVACADALIEELKK